MSTRHKTRPIPESTEPTPASPLTTRQLRRTAGVVIVGSVMSVLDMTIVNVALHRLSDAFHSPLATIQWTAGAYTLALAAVIPVAPWAIGRIGAKRTYLTALALFTLGSLLAACAWDAGSLIAFRAVQGLGGGLLMPVGMAMVMRGADPARLGRVMALLGLPIIVGPVIGPVLGGWLIDVASWQWIFLVNLPVGAVALALAAKLLRPDAPRGGSSAQDPAEAEAAARAPGLDVPGLLMLSPGLALLLFGLARGAEQGTLTAPGAFLPALIGATLVAAFGRRALTAREPLLDLRLLRDPTFGVGVATLALFTCGYFGSMLLGPMYWQQARGTTATAAGMLGAPVGLVVGLTMQIASRRIDKVSPRRLIRAGIATGALGMALTALQTGTADVAAWRVVAASMVMGVGAGMVLMPTMATASRDLPKDRMTAASTILSINAQIWASVGTALTSVTLSSVGTTPAGFRTTYAIAAVLLALALLPATRLPTRHPAAGHGTRVQRSPGLPPPPPE
ncbi:DHA2 family efflux MFS transporter permease subunit [Streptomyces sp. ICC4]|uniref:DHA2 family efflux MFS transporter permease subunit n=1 Tax=Streptomyces sp. ICC4 TaxID=2099584 RepID=UPI000DC7ABB9|nr:DHA2 family efflux MFS transporter permease subunit [Streptomyces sp. ICC4]AWZ09758.1 MFS transporter [Streptomyces sp. ICC4]